MQKLLGRPIHWRLQYILVISFALTTAIAIVVGTPLTYIVIRNYLDDAQDARVGRDMDLAIAFYNNKALDISSMAGRLASARNVRHRLGEASQGNADATRALDEAILNEISSHSTSTQRFVIFTDTQGESIAGLVSWNGQLSPIETGTSWSTTPIVNSVLTLHKPQTATEVIPSEALVGLGLDQQARISLIDTAKAAPEPFDPREGTAGLVLMSVSPVISEDGESLGAVLVGHLFNRDFTLVDRIKEVAGVDTSTIFFGDLRVSTNVEDEAGNRAIGTRVSQEVFDRVLVNGDEFTGPAYVVNQWYITRYEPLYDHLGSVVGMLYVGAKQAAFQSLVDSFARQVLLISGASIIIALLIAIPLSWSISRPLTGLARATGQVAEGDWSVRAPVRGYTEMQSLAESFNMMVKSLEIAQEQLIQQEKLASVGQLAAGVAHEINNPLGSVLLYADILCKETPEDAEQQREDLQMIIREATRCKRIVNDLLNFSRQNEILAQDTDLNAMLQELTGEIGRHERFRTIEIETDLDPTLSTIQADPLQLRQVLVNLISNAGEAMPDGGNLTLSTKNGPSDGLITLEVADTGMGIPEENKKKVFTPFFTTKPIGKGTGLGLAISYGIVKMHGGQIEVDSRVGQGTTFTITLREELPS